METSDRPRLTTWQRVVWSAVLLAVWIYQALGAMVYGSESHCLSEFQAILMVLVAPAAQIAVIIASIILRSRRRVIFWWGTGAAFGLHWITYATTQSGPYC
jgi:hypothetical protein